jgi:beta-N-acetylhexosaminidase
MRPLRTVAVVVGAVVVAACTSGGTSPRASLTSTPATATSDATPSVEAAAVASCVSATYNALTPDQRLGQLFLVGVPVANRTQALAVAKTLLADDHVGGIFLAGRSHAGVYTIAKLTKSFQALATTAATGHVGLIVATDQEGGQVQVLQGSGFGVIPSGVAQGHLSTAVLTARAKTWGLALHHAGVNLDLAPVADVVPAGTAADNPPIGVFNRQYGSTSSTVFAHASAFAAGLSASHVATTWKHFPGLGRVDANTDTTLSVHDTVTTVNSGSLLPFSRAVTAGAGWVMVSLATYDKIDPTTRAAYSSKIITSLLRTRFGFKGVVVSDALGAKSATSLPVSKRAAALIAAGGDIALTVEASLVGPMIAGVRARAASSPTFQAQVKASVLRVLTAKNALGLLPACR